MEISGDVVCTNGGTLAPGIGLSSGANTETSSIDSGVINGGNVYSTGNYPAGEMPLYTDASASAPVYQNILIIDGVSSEVSASQLNTSDGVAYSLSGEETFSNEAGQQILSVWLPESTSSEQVTLSILGSTYGATYIRQADQNINIMYSIYTPVQEITLDKTEIQLLPTGTESLIATVEPSTATDQSVVWSSSDTAVATVDSNGVVTAKNVGTATITATTTDGGYTATSIVTVTPATYTVTIH